MFSNLIVMIARVTYLFSCGYAYAIGEERWLIVNVRIPCIGQMVGSTLEIKSHRFKSFVERLLNYLVISCLINYLIASGEKFQLSYI